MAAQKEEAAKLVKSGKKLCEKGFFKKPKWDDGATDFQRAANLYMNAGDVQGSTEASRLAADAHAKAGNLFHAASALDSLATFLKNQDREEECAQVYCDAAKFYAQSNKPQNQADALAKAARCVKKENAASAVSWMREGIEALEEAERWHVLKDPYRALIILQVRADRIPDAIASEKKYIAAMAKADFPDLAAKCGLEIVILALSLGDVVLADREFKEMVSTASFGFSGSAEQRVAYELIDAAEQRDAPRLAEAGKDQRISFLITDVARLAKRLPIPGGAAPPRAAGGAATGKGAAGEQDGDDEEDCR